MLRVFQVDVPRTNSWIFLTHLDMTIDNASDIMDREFVK